MRKMVNKNFKMPVILIGNSFKYEIEATLKLFFHAERFSFSDNISDAVGDSYIIAEVKNNCEIFAEIMLHGKRTRFQKIVYKC